MKTSLLRPRLIQPLLRPSSSSLLSHHHHPHHRRLPTPRMAASYTPAPALRTPRVRLACVQMASGPDKAANLALAAVHVARAAHAVGPRGIVVLPECFNSPYGTQFFPQYAEVLPSSSSSDEATPSESPSFNALAAMARDNDVYLVGGSIPERVPAATTTNTDTATTATTDRLYNTSLIFGPDGTHLGTHRKIHLFDIDIPGKIRFRESDVLTAGDRPTLVHLADHGGAIAVAICYDVRFPELAAHAARRGAFALVYPGAFNLTTGPLHWELLARARAVDNQLYVAVCSPARDPGAAYVAWGHSLVVGPMADVLVEAGEGEQIVTAELVSAHIEEARTSIPLRTQRRFDVYPDVGADKV